MSTCKRCGEQIQWAKLYGKKFHAFNLVPEAETTPDGYVLRSYEGQAGLVAWDRREAEEGEPTYAFHLAVCPVQLEEARQNHLARTASQTP